jgi:hypothetical protein
MLVWAVVAMVVDLELGFVSLSNNEDFLDLRECLPKAITVRVYTYTFKEKKKYWSSIPWKSWREFVWLSTGLVL